MPWASPRAEPIKMRSCQSMMLRMSAARTQPPRTKRQASVTATWTIGMTSKIVSKRPARNKIGGIRSNNFGGDGRAAILDTSKKSLFGKFWSNGERTSNTSPATKVEPRFTRSPRVEGDRSFEDVPISAETCLTKPPASAPTFRRRSAIKLAWYRLSTSCAPLSTHSPSKADPGPRTSSTNSELEPKTLKACILASLTPRSCLEVMSTTSLRERDSKNTSPALTRSWGGMGGWISIIWSSLGLMPSSMSKLMSRAETSRTRVAVSTSRESVGERGTTSERSTGRIGKVRRLARSEGIGSMRALALSEGIGSVRALSPSDALRGDGAGLLDVGAASLEGDSGASLEGEGGDGSSSGLSSSSGSMPSAWTPTTDGSCTNGVALPLLRRMLSKLAGCKPMLAMTEATVRPTNRDSPLNSMVVTKSSPCSRTCRKRPPLSPGNRQGPKQTKTSMATTATGSATIPGSKKLKVSMPCASSRPFTTKLVLVPIVVIIPPMMEA
mmetsp:Transcript_11912/g.32068  ORF Transcript_11912/g.32068 Transcript_11912/m.32068 type:complete len:497 (+) Transcript_11912:112-1602(+)